MAVALRFLPHGESVDREALIINTFRSAPSRLALPVLLAVTDTPDSSAAGDGPPFEPTGAASPTYRHEGPAVSAIVYYVLLVTRRRRPLFADAAVKARVEELVVESAEEIGLGVRCVDVAPATVTVHVEAPPTMTPHEIVRAIRQPTAAALKVEFEAIRRAHSVFVRRYLVTTMPVPETDCAAFERSIPKR